MSYNGEQEAPAGGVRSSGIGVSPPGRWESSSNRFREVKGGGAPGCDGAGVRWFPFRFLTVCHIWWRGKTGPESMGSFGRGGGV